MRDVPECLSRRYRALDELIKDLTRSAQGSHPEAPGNSDAGIQLLCDFWNILKEDPDYDLVHAIQQRLGLVEMAGDDRAFRPENITCYMAGKCCKKDDGDDQRRETINKIRKICSSGSDNPKCCASKSVSPSGGSDVLPLSKVLCNLKEAASFDKKCNARIKELMDTQKVLQDQIQHLEHREKEGVQLLKQADCMWTCMEDTYNKKINESLERQRTLMEQLKEVEASTAKWRKNKKDLELQLVSIGKCHEEIKDKINQKNSDLKCMDVEIEDFKKRIENNKKDMDAVKKSFGTKKQASEAKIAKIATEISRLQKVVIEERKYKSDKEQEGAQYVQEAREELQKICKVLLKKKIENEDLRAEKEALNFELDVLKQTCDQCRDKCKNRQQEISNEIAKVDKQIKEFKVRCIRCHECTDTMDIRKCCTDCPRCIQERDCILEKDHCSPDHTMDCVCTTVKQKFLDNVFDNMYTVLEKQIKTRPGKAVADVVLNCLKKSRNGKLDTETRNILQEFILTTVKKNLNLTIVGGAVKTRCEMDPEMYKQLMLCLKQVKVVKPPKEDKATPAKKDSCGRWGGVSECNCPKGPKACICLKKAPPPPQDPSPCPPPTQDKEDEGVVIKCPHRETAACGADCAMHAVPSRVGADIAAWRPDPCREQSCRFSKNMRAAQCVLGPESLVSLPKGYKSTVPQVPDFQDLDELMTCKCGRAPTKPCNCQDSKQLKAGIIKPCDKVTCGSLWDEAKEKANRSYSQIEKEIGKEIYSEISVAEKFKKVPSVQTDVFSEAQRHLSSEISLPAKSYDSKNVTFGKDIKEENPKERFKVIFGDDDHTSNLFTELKTTESGKLALELDEKVIALIEEKCAENPNLFVTLNETDSGHNIIDFSPDENVLNKRQRIAIKKTPSGTRFLEVQKGFVNKLKQNDIDINNIMNTNTNSSEKPEKNICETACDCKDHLGTNENIPKISDDSNASDHKSCLPELQRLWNEGKKDIMLKVMGRNGVCKEINATLIENSPGVIGIDVSNISTFGDVTFKTGECPALLTPTGSGTLLLQISHEDHYNVSLRRSTVGGIILVANDSILKAAEPTHYAHEIKTKNEFFRVKVKSPNKLVEDPPAVLKITPSHNYKLVLDKEYEKTFKQTIDECIGDDYECFVELDETMSGNFMVILDDNNLSDNEPNALLTKSPSGHIKMLVNDPIFESVDSISPKDISSSKVFGQLLEKLPPSSRQTKTANIKETTLNDTKSCSDSHLYDKVKMKLPDQKDLLEPSATLTRTASGQYAVVLNKESKKDFVNRLRNYLSGSQGLIPIKRTISGEITIALNSDGENNCGYGSLKITPSGNIYITVDEKVIEGMVKNVKSTEISNLGDELSKHIIGSIKSPVNKSVTTTCNAKPETCSCDETKCVCKELQLDRWLQGASKCSGSYLKFGNCADLTKERKNSCGGYKICDPQKCKEPCCAGSKSGGSAKSPHIVIKPCDCRPILPKNPRSEECCYVVEAICPYHIDKYETVPNELLDISSLCNKSEKNDHALIGSKIKTKDDAVKDRSWDSLNYLPPQLPRFLQDVNFR
ncbi:hypothetical protein O3G_MSEX001461 [Manduca sexta]|uniref:Uncharacterized protein n=1 Tax=Manduca sexta TaxID=7130 RepID=A0A921YKB3_MANSE|nr:hypothetical protein O3G_MSEX001461 [Manduca sexta]